MLRSGDDSDVSPHYAHKNTSSVAQTKSKKKNKSVLRTLLTASVLAAVLSAFAVAPAFAQPEHEKMAGASKSKQDINCKMMGGCMMKRTALEMMDARIKHMEARLESMKAARPATEALYLALSDEQKKKADRLLGKRPGMM